MEALLGAAAAVVVLLALVGIWALQTAHRLDRLHVRYDLSWQALDGALARRAVVARAVAVETHRSPSDSPAGTEHLIAVAGAAERAPRAERETAENELSAALGLIDIARLPAALVAELNDAEARVLLARRFHNDAVRDTLVLRERPAVRLLHLGGHAPLPTYFEIAERGEVVHDATLRPRTSARVVLLDDDGKVLLFCGSDPAAAGDDGLRWWFTVGGEALDGERLPQAAAREIAEETGLRVAPDDLVGPLWRRDAVIDFNGAVMRSQEYFFVHKTRRFEPSAAGRTALERRYIHGHRWCDGAEIAALTAGGQPVYPRQLAELLPEANAAAGGNPVVPRGRLPAIH